MTPAITSAIPPTTKAPMTLGLALLPMCVALLACPRRGAWAPALRRRGLRLPPAEEGPNLRLGRGIAERLRVPHGQQSLGLHIQKDAVVADGHNARQLVGD